ncbi:MAG: gamma-glutamyltransferase [Gemmatimonadota bacterium]
MVTRPGRIAVVALAATPLAVCAPASGPQPQPAEVGAEARIHTDWPHPLDAEPVTASDGMIATDAPLATRVGIEILEAGGNAVDAAVATAFALAVVYPEAGNIGGGGFMVVRTADGETDALDFREKAPLAATRDMFVDEDGDVTDESITGHLASGVPGSVAGLEAAHRRFGSLPWSDLVRPAIALAEDGFVVNDRFAATVRGEADRLERFEASARLFLPDGRALRAGKRWRNPDLAQTLRRIAERGASGFYRGETADLIVAEMRRGGGLITHEDLRRYEPVWREPVAFDYRGHRVISMPPPSSGGLTMALMANILEAWDLAGIGRLSPRALHLTAEAMRRAFADRNHYLGDPDFVDVRREMFLSEDHAGRLRETISLERATPSSEVGPAAGDDGVEGTHTTHFGVVDADGNAVALTTTINFLYGSAVTVADAGFVLNDEMDDLTAQPGTPNAYGLIQGEANAIEPGKRPLSSMTPTIVLDPNAEDVLLVTGARGGPRIITGTFQVISNVIDHRLGIARAVNSPRVHHQHLPDVLYYEPNGLDAATVRALETFGHDVRERGGYIGHAPSILRVDGGWAGFADPRQGGSAMGPPSRSASAVSGSVPAVPAAARSDRPVRRYDAGATRTSTGVSRRITIRDPLGSTASTSDVPIAIAVPAAAPMTAPRTVDSASPPSTRPRIAPAAVPAATFAAFSPVVVRVCRSGFASTTVACSG